MQIRKRDSEAFRLISLQLAGITLLVESLEATMAKRLNHAEVYRHTVRASNNGADSGSVGDLPPISPADRDGRRVSLNPCRSQQIRAPDVSLGPNWTSLRFLAETGSFSSRCRLTMATFSAAV